MKWRPFIVVLLVVGAMLLAQDAHAQCVICRAAAEQGNEDGNTQSAALNSGIIYLLVMPYASIMVIGFLVWKNYKRRKAASEID